MIEAYDLHFVYPNGVEALKGVSLKIRNGEFVAIMGQNGAGKTTLVKHFNGLLKPTQGKVLIDGVDTQEVSVAKLARKVGFVFQNPDHQLFCETVEEEISFALKNFGFKENVIKRRVTWALNLLGLTRYRKTSPFMLSGGERKRVALASVLAWNPKILILDEPTIGQDYAQKEKLRQFILQMKAQKKTVIIVTHDVEFVAECNPRVVLMSNGKIVADGEARKILTSPEILEKASIIPPEVSRIFLELSNIGFPTNVIDIYEAGEIILDFWEGKRREHV
ncbi:ABC transporter ATP-binding protein [Candidatus Bathyarchaeota archaeon]|nr:MAG: ABC transporter ATP-binding protein [Candidatus Bathyarchaeota archaeon]